MTRTALERILIAVAAALVIMLAATPGFALCRADSGGIGGTGHDASADEGGIGGTGVYGELQGDTERCLAGFRLETNAETEFANAGQTSAALQSGQTLWVEGTLMGDTLVAHHVEIIGNDTALAKRLDNPSLRTIVIEARKLERLDGDRLRVDDVTLATRPDVAMRAPGRQERAIVRAERGGSGVFRVERVETRPLRPERPATTPRPEATEPRPIDAKPLAPVRPDTPRDVKPERSERPLRPDVPRDLRPEAPVRPDLPRPELPEIPLPNLIDAK